MGSPEFAVPSLSALLASQHKVVGVITQPDRPAGRGMQLQASPIKQLALKHKIPLFQPEKLNSQATLDILSEWGPQLITVVAYGEFLGERILKFCSQHPVNVHPSLLPDLRGAAPMQWALLRGYKKTGVSTQFMAKQMDAGDIILQVPYEIPENENYEEMSTKLSRIGADLLVETCNLIECGKANPKPQDHEKATLAPLLSKELGNICWQEENASAIHNKVRGLYPWPSAHTYFQGKRCKILATEMLPKSECPQKALAPGQFLLFGNHIFVRCADSWLKIIKIQPEGKRALLSQDFANGIKATEGLFETSEKNEK